jgi:alpha-tubulin suppressor-like RCC1 family protein
VGGHSFVQITGGFEFSCALKSSGAAWCWGHYPSWAYKGQMGNGALEPSPTPVEVLGGLSFADISSGWMHTCGRLATGDVWCWGSGSSGQCGNEQTGSSAKFPTPVQVPGGHQFVQIATAKVASHTCGLEASGNAWCWG